MASLRLPVNLSLDKLIRYPLPANNSNVARECINGQGDLFAVFTIEPSRANKTTLSQEVLKVVHGGRMLVCDLNKDANCTHLLIGVPRASRPESSRSI